MKFKFLSKMTKLYFKTNEDGEKLFYPFGSLSKPYIIPDHKTENKLYKKHLMLLRILWGFLILCQPIIFVVFTDLILKPIYSIIYFVSIISLIYIIIWTIYKPDIKELKKKDKTISFYDYFSDIAKKYKLSGLILTLIISIGFVALGIWILNVEINLFIGWAAIIFFSICSIIWSYILYIKITLLPSE